MKNKKKVSKMQMKRKEDNKNIWKNVENKEGYCKLSSIDEIIAALYIFLRTNRFIKTA